MNWPLAVYNDFSNDLLALLRKDPELAKTVEI